MAMTTPTLKCEVVDGSTAIYGFLSVQTSAFANPGTPQTERTLRRTVVSPSALARGPSSRWVTDDAAGGKHGQASIFSVITGGVTQNDTTPPTFPAFLTDLKSFSLTGFEPDIPEPSPGLLLALAGGLFLGLRQIWPRR